MSGHYLTFLINERIVFIYSLDDVLCYLVASGGATVMMASFDLFTSWVSGCVFEEPVFRGNK